MRFSDRGHRLKYDKGIVHRHRSYSDYVGLNITYEVSLAAVLRVNSDLGPRPLKKRSKLVEKFI